jgi:hypothetical protein
MTQPNWWRQFREDGTIDRLPYFLVGLILCIIKFRIDNGVANIGYGRDWTPWDYLISGSTLTTLLRVPEDRSFFLMLFALSLPFVVIGVGFTYARLRSAGLNPVLVTLFFLPVLNLILILILAILKPREAVARRVVIDGAAVPAPPAANDVVLSYGTDQSAGPSIFRDLFPKAPGPSLALAATLSAGSVLLMIGLSVEFLQNYGWGAFVALPFLCGLIAAVLHGVGEPRSLKQCLAAAALAPTILGAGVIVVAIEGAVCVLMALPIIIPMSLLGGIIGYHLQRGPLRSGGTQTLVLILIAFMPIFLGAEHVAHPRRRFTRPSRSSISTRLPIASGNRSSHFPESIRQPSGSSARASPTQSRQRSTATALAPSATASSPPANLLNPLPHGTPTSFSNLTSRPTLRPCRNGAHTTSILHTSAIF